MIYRRTAAVVDRLDVAQRLLDVIAEGCLAIVASPKSRSVSRMGEQRDWECRRHGICALTQSSKARNRMERLQR